jgi:hypothetical protein
LFQAYVVEDFEALAKKSEEMTELFLRKPIFFFDWQQPTQKKLAKAKDYLELEWTM